jgi:hypothetical protein
MVTVPSACWVKPDTGIHEELDIGHFAFEGKAHERRGGMSGSGHGTVYSKCVVDTGQLGRQSL